MRVTYERILLGFFLVIALSIAILGFVNYRTNQSYIKATALVAHTDEVLKTSGNILTALLEVETRKRGYIITGDTAFLAPLREAESTIFPSIAYLRELTIDNPEQQRNVDSLEYYAHKKIEFVNEVIQAYNTAKFTEAAKIEMTYKGKPYIDKSRVILRHMNATEEKLLAQRRLAYVKSRSDFNFTILLIIITLALLMSGIIIAFALYYSGKASSERKLLELNRSLQENVAKLETVNRELDAFTYSVSHDLRAPLRIINGFSTIINDEYKDKMDEEGKRYIEVIQANAKHMGNLIDNLLNFSRISRQEISMELCNMNDLVGRVVETQKLVYEKSQLNIHIKPLLPAQCDGALIRHVWENLVSNAIKYTSKTSEPKIEIGTKDDKDQVIYYIKDNGAGFDMTYAGKLFGVFQRMHHQKDFEGTGVGLALASRIITRHGGKIWAEAKVNEGAIFYFSLPKKQQHITP